MHPWVPPLYYQRFDEHTHDDGVSDGGACALVPRLGKFNFTCCAALTQNDVIHHAMTSSRHAFLLIAKNYRMT